MVITVTFDANALAKISSYPEIFSALKEGRIKGYFSQTYHSLEGIQRNERAEVLARTAVAVHSKSRTKDTVDLSIEIRHYRPPLDDKYQGAVKTALDMGLRALRGPARMVDGLTVRDTNQSFYVIEPIEHMIAHREKAGEVAAAIEKRGVGRAISLNIGNKYNELSGVTIDKPKLWLQGLAQANTDAQKKKVAKAIAEWSDGDSIASHIGYGIDLFCSEDFGKNTSGPSVMNPDNRGWLSETYGVVFITLSELAEKLADGQ
ncbi:MULTISPECIES: hypothetical protein [Acidithiobacillus]|jgi:hypothetical protein|uniref:Uncharacterized protein n=2 Tax=Acidithiobacillus ferrooxidans TaxID=920 RepID=B7J8L4_ACIF2|nr:MULTISPECIES: hypothetical protein [Acidithiobacillus]ACH84608.1 hypothetical protein Lferr_2412 [Acidithiobacillus ferrooxidans ATCC 53993]ACK77864.1 hypothetical protein AFE_2789 [Acidithiobacillus ferrooxidans ATCC 23270]MBN6744623.1 hypothetical protein [Acidithiobacillus sp. MC2.2]MBN6747501.1 hypothetical protein [Acidithiobacillus sp. PG05]MBU2773799.1 hypothetical protein [Acidithiobacillus ferrooxidans]